MDPPREAPDMKTALQLGDIATHEGRVWVSASVLSGSVEDGDRLDAVGLATVSCVVDEVRVAGMHRKAVAGEECQIFLRDPDPALQREGTQAFLALVESGSITHGTALRVSLTWASLRDELPGSRPGSAPALQQPITQDIRVEVRFVDLKVAATLKAPAVPVPVGGTNEWDLILDRPLPVIPRFGFSMDIQGDFAATGKVLGPG